MKRTRLAAALPLSLALLVLVAVEPVAAQSASADLINELNEKLLIVAIPITVLVEGILIYTILRFRNTDEAKPTRENRRLEITWTVATAIILLFVGVASYGVLANENVTLTQEDAANIPEDAALVEAHAYQWNWNMSYPREGLTNVQGGDTDLTDTGGPVIVIPSGTDVYFRVTADQVIHGFHVPQLGLKMDAIPGQTNVLKTDDVEPGEYQGYCTEYCGVGHSQMYFTVVVVPQEDYDAFVASGQEAARANVDVDADADAVDERAALATSASASAPAPSA
jgi:cytochrome c oxidase subunit 2